MAERTSDRVYRVTPDPNGPPAPKAQTVAEIKEAFAAIAFGRDKALWLEKKNAIHVWRVYRIARKKGVAVPAWVLEYLDECAEGLLAPQGTTSPEAIAKALRFRVKGGGPSPGKRAITERRDLEIVDRVLGEQRRRRMRGTGTSDEEIFGEIGDRFDLSTERVRNIFYDWTVTVRPPQRRPGRRK